MLLPRQSRPLPFAINRSLAASLSDQVADGLRRAIVSGYYRRGDVLPTLEELARVIRPHPTFSEGITEAVTLQ